MRFVTIDSKAKTDYAKLLLLLSDSKAWVEKRMQGLVNIKTNLELLKDRDN